MAADYIWNGKKTNNMKKFVTVVILMTALISGLAAADAGFKPSVEIFLEKHLDAIRGKRVGLITNPTGVDSRLRSTADLLHAAEGVELAALFGPEHGIRGNTEGGRAIDNQIDERTGIPVYSLYSGDGKGPAEEVLKELDVLIYHIQDVGSRCYTYVWSMAICMRAAARQDKEFIVLDVPNPLLPLGLDGPGVDADCTSFVGLYDVPFVYGLTTGELARYLNEEENIHCRLTVIPMEGYTRQMTFEETGLIWVPTSPNIPSVEAAVCYPITCPFGEFGAVNTGIGWTLPFQVVGTPYLPADDMADYLNARNFAGIVFRPIHYRPTNGFFAQQDLHGVQLHVTDMRRLRPQEISYAIMSYIFSRPEFAWPAAERMRFFANITGSPKFQQQFSDRVPYRTMVEAWQQPLRDFQEKARAYYLYPER